MTRLTKLNHDLDDAYAKNDKVFTAAIAYAYKVAGDIRDTDDDAARSLYEEGLEMLND
jgi:hypothetical protein